MQYYYEMYSMKCAVYYEITMKYEIVGSVVEWLKRRTRDQHGLGSKPTRAILLCPWEKHFTLLGGPGKQF